MQYSYCTVCGDSPSHLFKYDPRKKANENIECVQTCEHTGYGYSYYTDSGAKVYYCAQCSQEETNKTYESAIDSANPQNTLCVQQCPTTFRSYRHQTGDLGFLKYGEGYCSECGSSSSDLLLYSPEEYSGNILCVTSCERKKYGYDYFLHNEKPVYYCQLCSESDSHNFFAATVRDDAPANTLCVDTCKTQHRSYYEYQGEKYCKNCDFENKHALATEPDGKSNVLCVQKCDEAGSVPVSVRQYKTYNG